MGFFPRKGVREEGREIQNRRLVVEASGQPGEPFPETL